MKPRLLAATAALVAAFAAAPTAHASGVFAGEVIDGPSNDIVRMGDLDVARDGTGAVAYVKRDGGTDHIFVSRLVDGAWQPPERVDPGLNDAGSSPAVAASDGGRVAVAYVSGGTLYAVVKPANAPFSNPQSLGAPAATPSIDMSINGAAYIAYTSGSDVRAARLDRTAESFTELGAVLDVDPAQPAGDTAARRPDVAISADGTGVATWGERGADGRQHIYARRLYNSSLSTAPQDLTLGDFQGHSAGDADSPDVDVEDDSSYGWVSFRQVLDGVPRSIARRLVGSKFQDPNLVDPLGFPAPEGIDAPAIDLNGTGAGLVASDSSGSHQVYAASLQDDKFEKGAVRVDAAGNAIAPRAMSGLAQNGDGFVTWLQSTGSGDPVGLRVRQFDNVKGFAPEVPLTNPDLGAVDTSAGYDAAVDRVDDGAAVAVQGTGNDRRLVAGMVDREPGSFVGTTTQKVRRFQGLRWAAAFDLWGKPTYTVVVNNQPVGTTQDTSWSPPQGVPDGVLRWRVLATDRRGQVTGTATRLLRVDNTPPTLDVGISGTRKAGKLLKFRFRSGDVQNPGASGLRQIRVVWGDGRAVLTGKTAAHRFRRGRYTVRVSATDKAGNFAVVRKRLVIKKK